MRRLFFTDDRAAAQVEIEHLGGRIVFQLTDRVLVVFVPDEAPLPPLATLQSEPPAGLDETSRQVAAAWLEAERLRNVPSPKEGWPWNTAGHGEPRYVRTNPDFRAHERAFRSWLGAQRTRTAGNLQNSYLRGSVAVAVWTVSGTSAELVLSTSEAGTARVEALKGLDWLISNVPPGTARMVWSWRSSTVDAPLFGSATLPKIGASASPSVVAFEGKLYCFHQGSDSSGALWYTKSADGEQWDDDVEIRNVGMSASPAAVEFRKQLYCFHQGFGDNGELWYTSWNGTEWQKDTKVEGVSLSGSPAVAVLKTDKDERLYCFYRRRGKDELWFTSWDGKGWAKPQRLQGAALSDSPALIVWNTRLYCFHQGRENNGTLWFTSSKDGKQWDRETPVPDLKMTGSPALAVADDGALFCFHQGADGNEELWCAIADASGAWQPDARVANVTMSKSPSAAFFGGSMRCFTRAAGGGNTLRNTRVYTVDGQINPYEQCEAPWRDQALQQAGYPAGMDGLWRYVSDVIDSARTDWGFVIFITKYTNAWFAYAGQARVVMEYGNDGWGTGELGRVIAHETAHIFRADDEYSTDRHKCTCGPAGYYSVPNKNCAECTTAQAACLMDRNTLSVCEYTRGQLGWPMAGLVVAYARRDNSNEVGVITFNGSGWGTDFTILGLQSSESPALVDFQGVLHCFHQGPHNDGRLRLATSQGYWWNKDELIATVGITGSPAPLNRLGQQLYCFHQGADSNGELWYASAGKGWEDKKMRDVRMSKTPAPVVFEGIICVFFHGHRENGELWWSGPSGTVRIASNAITDSPSAIVFSVDKTMYCFHQGSRKSGQLWCTKWKGGETWESVRIPNVKMSFSPCVVEFDHKLFVFHPGAGANGELWYTSSADGTTWSADTRIPDVAISGSPSAIAR